MNLNNYVSFIEQLSLSFPPDSRKTIRVKCTISNKRISKVSFLPVIINKKGKSEILTLGDERFNKLVRYLDLMTRDQGLDTKYIINGNEVIVDR